MGWTEGDECEAHELSWCALCKPKPPVEPRTAPQFRTAESFETVARYDGPCYACRGFIEAGDPIKRDDEGRWVHKDC